MKISRLTLSFLTLLFLSSCYPPYPTLPVYAKKKPKRNRVAQVRWFRITFYRLYRAELRAADYGDRLRRFIRLHPPLARITFEQNRRRVQQHQRRGKRIGKVEKVLLQMNAMIRLTLSLQEPIYLQVRTRRK